MSDVSGLRQRGGKREKDEGEGLGSPPPAEAASSDAPSAAGSEQPAGPPKLSRPSSTIIRATSKEDPDQ